MDGRDLTPTQPTPITRRRALARALFGGGCAGLRLSRGTELYHAAAGGNVHEVIPRAVYRCSQPTPARLEALVKQHGIRTVVNLRGCSDPTPWYIEESRATVRFDLS